MHIYFIGSTCDDVFRTNIVIHSAYIFVKSPFYCCYSAQYFSQCNKNIILDFCCKSCWFPVQNYVSR
jgi:hypothetical protein